jgi:uncharacterized membrane protein YbhN (UPF0104 family)
VSPHKRAPWWFAAVGAALALGLLFLAKPASVLEMTARVRLPALLVALLGTLALMVIRGTRLSLLAGRRLAPTRAVAVVAVTQLASGLLPLRLGELSLVPLLGAAGLPGTIRGLSLLVLARVLDLAALLVWVVVAAALIGGSPAVAVLGLAFLLLAFPLAVAGGQRWLRWAAQSWRTRRGWRRRVLLQLLRVRGELVLVVRSPARAWGCVALSLFVWGAIWGVTVALLRGMAITWPPGPVLLGVLGAALGSSLPVNSVGNFGTQEAGWAAALSGVGVPPRQALAAGFASHLWILIFSVVLGAAGAAYLVRIQPGSSASTLLASVRSFLRSGRGA